MEVEYKLLKWNLLVNLVIWTVNGGDVVPNLKLNLNLSSRPTEKESSSEQLNMKTKIVEISFLP